MAENHRPADGICLALRDLTLGYAGRPVIHAATADIAAGALVAIVGANGCGKSTLMKGMAGVLRPLGGACLRQPDCRVAYLPQQSELDRSFPARVVDLVAQGLWPRRGLLGRHRPQDRAAVGRALEAVGLSAQAASLIDTLSGGQLQRALFARAIVQDAGLILLDEPFNAVDRQTMGDMLALIARWHAEGRTVVMVSHGAEVASDFQQVLALVQRADAGGSRTQLAPVRRGEPAPRAPHRDVEAVGAAAC
ncbi:zinc ABC transporter ATP-binding protein AztA [Pigmentiphaga soli]|uniref:Zinc ABC transporter ATP-binding protein AztA n=1 Tax=Pigmentiphaga soli TaxID=1007095 RepID=A0ABP8HEN0_9BURK